MKRKQSQRKRNSKATSLRPRADSNPAMESGVRVAPEKRLSQPAPARHSVAPAAAAAVLETELEQDQAFDELDAVLPRERHDSGEISIEPRPRLFGQVDLHTESNFFSGYSGDLSDGGVFVVTYAALKLGQSVDVELSLPGGLFIAATGRVAFLRAPSQHNADLAPGAGIVFDDLDSPARRAAESFMLRREPTFVDPN